MLFVVSDMHSVLSKTGSEFTKVKNLVSVLVEFAKKVNHVFLKAAEILSGSSDLSHNSLKRCLGEHFVVVFHVLSCVLVC